MKRKIQPRYQREITRRDVELAVQAVNLEISLSVFADETAGASRQAGSQMVTSVLRNAVDQGMIEPIKVRFKA